MNNRSRIRRKIRALLPYFLAVALPCGAAENNSGSWSPQERAAEAMRFFNRMTAEFKERADRLKGEGENVPDVACPFVESSSSTDPKVAEDWARFIKGDMGELGTTRWISKGLKELEVARKKLAASEKPAAAAWDKKHKDGRKQVELPPAAEEFIYDIQVQARNLGVILDNSRSMTRALPAVRTEITRRFSGARFVEVDGCELEPHSERWGLHGEWYYAAVMEERNPFVPKWFLPEIPQNDIHYHMIEWQRDPLAAIESMIMLMEVDALYWFCDFDDEIQLTTVKRIGELIEKHKVRLYVHTVKANPPGSLSNIIKRSGGKLTRADPGVPRPAPADIANAVTKPLTQEVVKSSINQVVRLTGTIRDVSVTANNPGPSVHLSPVEAGLLIRFPKDAWPRTASHAAIRAEFPPGRRFEVTGQITVTPQSSVPVIDLASRHDLKVLAEEIPRAGLVTAPISPEVVKASVNQAVRLTGTVGRAMTLTGVDGTTVSLTPVEANLHIRLSPSAFPAGSRAEDIGEFMLGRKFVVTGVITIPEAGGRALLDVKSVSDLIWLTPGIPKPKPVTTGVPANPDKPAAPVEPAVTPGAMDLTEAAIAANIGKDVKFEAVVKSAERMAVGNHVKIHFRDTSLYALCRAEKLKEIFPGVDPLADVQAGDKVRIKGRITRYGESPQVILNGREQFLTMKRVRDVPGTGGREKQAEQTTEIDIK